MEAEEVVREQLESVFVHALTMKGVPSETSLVFMNQPRAYSPDEISEIMGQAGLDGFLRVRLEDFHTEGRELHHSGGVYVGPGFFMAHPPRVSYHERTRLSLRLDLFQRPGGPLVWTGRGRARGPGRASLSRLARHLGAKLAHRLFSGRLVTPRAG